ncbi:MAG: vitamin B12-dependent ribonucleotide reductase [candidate division KSB1 bacterium]|jgi:ribonucleoside-diphosphate reductase alpha chain|nr:vitamin B12-dependent ribonucleotide reductase [candidate division KSB1 bacterium]
MGKFSILDSKTPPENLELLFDQEKDSYVFSIDNTEDSVAVEEIVDDREEDVVPELCENALTVLQKRYLLKNKEGKIVEDPEQMFRRVARVIASADKNYDPEADIESVEREFYNVMARLEFLPNSPTLMNAGRKLGQLSACFVLPVEDSMESIFETIKNTALIHKSGGGTGFSFSRIRPRNDLVQSTKGVSSGPVSFMTVFDAATDTIKQGGTRRGANMAILRIDHPDILDFINCKHDHDKLNNFNISVSVTDKFMEALEKGGDYELINPRTKEVAGKLNAASVFELIVKRAWQNGDPGIVFIDRINEHNRTPELGEIESTNPCGEQPLLPYESCNLGSINLSKMVTGGEINYNKIKRTVHTAIHFLDNVIDVNRYPLPQIEKITRANRKIGLGVMGFADMLIKLGIPYNDDHAIETARAVMEFINEEAEIKSEEIARKRGEFPNFDSSLYKTTGHNKVRNVTRTTIAPTGTLSIIADCSSGIEPLFAVCFVRNVLDDNRLLYTHPEFEKMARERGFYSPELMDNIAVEGGVQKFDEVPEDLKSLFITSHDIEPKWHVKMQAAFQEFTDNAVSKTVNFPNDATETDVREVYMLAYKHGCKGVTIYRDGSRDVQVLKKGTKPEAKDTQEAVENLAATGKMVRPEILDGKTIKMKTGCGSLYVTINEENGVPFELFNTMGKAGGCAASQSEAIGRLVSLTLRRGISFEDIVKELGGISCHKPHGIGRRKNLSCSDAIANAINIYLQHEGMGKGKLEQQGGACPECGGPIEHESGCAVCRTCGYSECQ